MTKIDELITLEQLQKVSKKKQDKITDTNKLKADLVEETSDKKFVTNQEKTDIASNTSARHTHSNKELLDTYTQTEANLADAVSKKHSHSNKSVLDATTASYTTEEKTKLSGIESGAEVNVQSDWEESDNSKDEFIKNKPEFERVDDRLIPILPYIDPDKEYDFIDHTNEPTYRFTAPANSKLLMLQSIAGNSVKYSPSVASDNNATHIKTLPSTVYDLDVSKVEGVGYKVNQLVANGNFNNLNNWSQNGVTASVNNNIVSILASSQYSSLTQNISFINAHKYLMISSFKLTTATNNVQFRCNDGLTNFIVNCSSTTDWQSLSLIFTSGNTTNGTAQLRDNRASDWDTYYVKNVNIFDLTADFGSGNEPSTVSDCATEYAKRGIDIYSYTPQQSSIKNNAFTGVTIDGANLFNGELENGGYNASGEKVNTYPKRCRCVNPFELEQGTYTFSNTNGYDVAIYCKDIDGNVMYDSGRETSPCSFTINRKSVITTIQIIQDSINPLTPELAGNCMLNYGSTALTYVPYIQPTTIPIDLTTIKDSNNVSLFPSGKLMGTNNADFITPYNQESRWNELDLSTPNWQYWGSNNCWLYEITSIIKYDSLNYLCDKYQLVNSYIDMPNNSYFIRYYNNQAYIYIKTDGTQVTRPSGILQYERATYLTSNTDLTSLTGIQGQSLGTITLNNTGNVDMPNLISYNGVIKHSLATAVKQDGFNVWDEEWEIKFTNYLFSKNFIPVLPNTTYYYKNTNANSSTLYYYDSDNVEISNTNFATNNTFTTPSNCYFIKFSYVGTSYTSGVCINISNQDLNGTYKPYKAPITRLLPNSEAKYSWGITDGVRNVRTYCDDEGNAVNEGSLAVGNQDLGGLNYTYESSYSTFKSTIGDIYNNLTRNILCYKYETSAVNNWENMNDKEIAKLGTNSITIMIKDTIMGNNSTIFKNAMSGVPFFYPKNTTDTETLDDFDYFFDCEEGDTFTIIGCELLQCYATYSFVVEHVE